MCFSSASSFGAAAVLAVAGVASIAKVRNRSEFLFASIPIIFALQQTAEGLIWLCMENESLSGLKIDLTYFYLFVAESVWPVLIPLSLLLPEQNRTRKNLLRILLGIGIFTSVYLAFYLLTYGVDASVEGCHILYIQHLHSPYSILTSLPYLGAAILPFWISGIRGIRRLALAITLSYLLAKFFYDYQMLSVWSFFAAMVSAFVYYIMALMHPEHYSGSLSLTRHKRFNL